MAGPTHRSSTACCALQLNGQLCIPPQQSPCPGGGQLRPAPGSAHPPAPRFGCCAHGLSAAPASPHSFPCTSLHGTRVLAAAEHRSRHHLARMQAKVLRQGQAILQAGAPAGYLCAQDKGATMQERGWQRRSARLWQRCKERCTMAGGRSARFPEPGGVLSHRSCRRAVTLAASRLGMAMQVLAQLLMHHVPQ